MHPSSGVPILLSDLSLSKSIVHISTLQFLFFFFINTLIFSALAETALSIANINPRVALLTFSTKGSANHECVDKVIEAGRIIGISLIDHIIIGDNNYVSLKERGIID